MTKIYARLVHPKNGYDYNREEVKILDDTINYPVESVSMGQSNTSFIIKGIPGSFNSVQFEFFDENFKCIDIYAMPEFNPYLVIDK